VSQNGHAQRRDHAGHGEDVVEMRMSEKDREHVQAGDRGEDTARFVAGVHDQRATVATCVHDPAVGVEYARDDAS
jgi:hypothetical protein